MSLFQSPEQHSENPPNTWQATRAGRNWRLTTSAGDVLSSHPTKRAAEEAKTSGFHANLYAKESRWYAGEPIAGWKPYRTPAEVAALNPASSYPGYDVSRLQAGDRVRLAGETGERTVTANDWNSDRQAHRLTFAGGAIIEIVSADRARCSCTLLARPGIPDFHREYTAGERVTILTREGKSDVGVVTEVHRHQPGPDGVAYEVQTIRGSTAAGPDRMHPDTDPMPAPGQRWITMDGARTTVVKSVDQNYPGGLVAVCDPGHSVILGAPHWRYDGMADTPPAELEGWGQPDGMMTGVKLSDQPGASDPCPVHGGRSRAACAAFPTPCAAEPVSAWVALTGEDRA